jgi:hypothetical protein
MTVIIPSDTNGKIKQFSDVLVILICNLLICNLLNPVLIHLDHQPTILPTGLVNLLCESEIIQFH